MFLLYFLCAWKIAAITESMEAVDRRGVPALVDRALRDDNPHPRWRSLWALSSVDREGVDAVPLLLAGLKDDDPVVVRNAPFLDDGTPMFYATHKNWDMPKQTQPLTLVVLTPLT